MVQTQNAKFETGHNHAADGNRQRDTRFPLGNVGIFMKLTLAVVYLYMMYFGYLTMGWRGLTVVSLLFLAALCAPVVYSRFVRSSHKRRGQETSIRQSRKYEADE